VRRTLEGLLDALAAEFGLRGVNGLDFLLDGERLSVLEVNPRPPASIALYRDVLPGGMLRAHVAASREGELPDVQEAGSGGRIPADAATVMTTGGGGAIDGCEASANLRALHRGFELVFADRHCIVGEIAANTLARLGWCHDLPAAGTRFGPGDPVCTVSAADPSLAGVQARLARRRRLIPSLLEQADEGSSEGARARELECQ